MTVPAPEFTVSVSLTRNSEASFPPMVTALAVWGVLTVTTGLPVASMIMSPAGSGDRPVLQLSEPQSPSPTPSSHSVPTVGVAEPTVRIPDPLK